MVVQIKKNIWCMYESFHVRVTCGCNILDYIGTKPSVGEITLIGELVLNVMARLIIDKEKITLLASKSIMLFATYELFLFKEEKNIKLMKPFIFVRMDLPQTN